MLPPIRPGPMTAILMFCSWSGTAVASTLSSVRPARPVDSSPDRRHAVPAVTDSASIFGREAELQAIEEFLDGIGGGASALRLEEEAGIGKTTLWQAAVRGARERGQRVMVTRP